MLEKIAKLLNQAENAGTEAEAAAFMERAQQLATTHSIDLARARHATKAKERTLPVQRNVHIGNASTRGLRTICDLYLGIAAANDIRVTIAHNATEVYAVGFAEDIDVSMALFASLQVQMAKALDEFKREGSWKNETVYIESQYNRRGECTRRGGWKPVTWLTARINFQDAYASRIRGRLLAAKLDEERRIEAEEEQAKARPHLTEDGVLTPEFVAWVDETHGVDLLDDDVTSIELSEALIKLRRVTSGGVDGVIVADDEAAEIAAEVFGQYLDSIASSETAGTELVLVEKRQALDEAYAPLRRAARGSYRGGHSGATSHSGRRAGADAANRANIGRSTAIGGVKGSISA